MGFPHRWQQSGYYFPKLAHFFRIFKKGHDRTSPLSLYLRAWMMSWEITDWFDKTCTCRQNGRSGPVGVNVLVYFFKKFWQKNWFFFIRQNSRSFFNCSKTVEKTFFEKSPWRIPFNSVGGLNTCYFFINV